MARHIRGGCWIEYRWIWGGLTPAWLDGYPQKWDWIARVVWPVVSRLMRRRACFDDCRGGC